jgi:hypothetical protein
MLTSSHATTIAPSSFSGTRANVVILTSGLTGSSVLTGLFAHDSYWPGRETFKKEYDTFENVDLIEQNVRLMGEIGYTGRYEMEFRPDVLRSIAELGSRLDDGRYKDFLTECNRHQPWVWKDPRLWLTIRFWNHLLDWNRCKVIVLARGRLHQWVSATLRRQIRGYASLKRYEDSIEESILSFLGENHIPYLYLTYERLISHPHETIARLNAHVGSNLTIEDLTSTYRGKLHQVPRGSAVDFVKATLIYLKNRSERWDLKDR